MLKIIKNTSLYIFVVLFFSFISKIIDLNYNSPFGDEAVYIAIGNSILFKWNWALYNSASWLGGHTYFYPVLSSIAYFFNGIVGARLVNVVISVIGTYYVYLITKKILIKSYGLARPKRIELSALFSAIFVAFSYSMTYVSRLATYDMPSFTSLIIAIYYLIDSSDIKRDEMEKSKRLFVSAVFLSLSFAFKYITSLYIPTIVLFVFIFFVGKNKKMIKPVVYYFLVPLVVFVSLLSLTQLNYLLTYAFGQVHRESNLPLDIVSAFIRNTYYMIPVLVIVLFNFIKKKDYFKIFVLAISMFTIIFFHLLTGRISALDKHSFLIVLPIAIFVAFPIYELLNKKMLVVVFSILSIFYVTYSMQISTSIKYKWPNYSKTLDYLEHNVDKGDIVLSENSATVILSGSKNINVDDIKTFDWFTYKNKVGKEAYALAVFEGYFKYIELEYVSISKPETYKEIYKVVADNLTGNYSQVFVDDNSVVYKRDF